MATAAFKSTTKRTSVGASSADDSASSSSLHHRRSRSLSRPARHTFPSRDDDGADRRTPKGRFVNTVRGSVFPEISLDDLAIEFFESANRGRFGGARTSESEASPAGAGASQRRGRSVSRKSSGTGDDRKSGVGGGGGVRPVADANSRRRRSVSVVRYQISDSESDLDQSQNSRSRSNLKNADVGNKLMHEPVASDQRPVLRKSLSQRDLRVYDGYSSHSSALTDDEAATAHSDKSGVAKLRPVHAQKKVPLTGMDKGLHKAKQKVLRNMEPEQAVVKPRTSTLSTGDHLLSSNSSIRSSYETELEQSDLDQSQNSRSRSNLKNADVGNKLMHEPVASDQRPVLRKSLSQRDLRVYDGYSSHSSALTDDEAATAHSDKSGVAKLRPVHAQKKVPLTGMDKGLHKAKQKVLRNMEPEQAVVKPRTSTLSTGDHLLSSNSSIRSSYETELEQSEKRKQELLAEIVYEEQRGRELSKIVSELIPAKEDNHIQNPSRIRKRSNDRSRVSMRLTEEAERYIEDFISNVEDTDISSLDGERSDASSSIGGLIKPETFNSLPVTRSLPVLMDGVALPWLQWETGNDASPMTSLNKARMAVTPKTSSSTQDNIKVEDQGSISISSRGSWSPDYLQEYVGKDVYSKFGDAYCHTDQSLSAKSKGLRYDMDDYLKVKSNEDLLIESWMQRRRINSGSLLLCSLRLF
ncbi:hypothetical protein LR48_Vigan04g150600 [Vigna angularis]|uniref:Uncharacterized protein n=1 Tax=Phaseolus angularis TaxID=3914 RepID=A0A0L9UEY8_PHAAN|nr:hypothetical protein LR48_Vigan04g150600 [Vigna angularis]